MSRVLALLLIIFALASSATPAFAAVSSTQLIESSQAHDGEKITYVGEAIGDVMKRGENGWVNVHDGDNAIGIWAQVDELNKIGVTGDYGHIGNTVLVKGTYNRACSEHGGEADIHAESLSIVEAGSAIEHSFNLNKAFAAAILAPLALALFFIERYRKKHFVARS